jgi:hypothetical protein
MFILDPRSEISIPDPGPKRFRIPIQIKEYKYFEPKKLFLSSRKHDPGCDLDLDFLPIPDPGVKKAPDPGSGTLESKITENPP